MDTWYPRSLKTLTQLTPISEKEKDIPDDDFDFPTRTPLQTDTTDQPSPLLNLHYLLLLFLYIIPSKKDDYWNGSVCMFHLKGGGV